ncbi:hypothetical protein B0H13DRAFT_2316255 [Mycena leptocephala]|nr:hypothetical protein B0H13DRAFT_2316255 [Mycena leptocephala]
MGGTYVTELTNRRNAKRGNTPSIYDGVDNDKDRPAFFDYVNFANDNAFSANIVAEIGSEDEGTWMRAYPKKILDSKLVLKSKVAMHYGYSPGLKKFNPEEVERETKQCVVNAKIGRNAP